MIKKRMVASTLACVLMAQMLSGCNMQIIADDVTKYPLENMLSEQELVDYYKKAMAFDTIATKNIDVQEATYEMREVSDTMAQNLAGLVGEVEQVLGQAEYPYEEENVPISDGVYNYIKTALDDKQLSGGTITKTSEALGFYFVDVEYNVSARSPGKFTDKSVYVGINGAFRKNYYDEDYIDTAFMIRATKLINEYFLKNRINESFSFNKETLELAKLNENKDLEAMQRGESLVNPSGYEDAPEADEEDEATTDNTAYDNLPAATELDSEDETVEGEGEEEGNEIAYQGDYEELPIQEGRVISASYTIDTREPQFNVKLFNQIVGSSMTQQAYIPRLDLVYQLPTAEGTISGYGIYPCGNFGLRSFGFNRQQLEGKITLRYLFKDDVLNPTKQIAVSVYPVMYELVSGINPSNESPNVPNFVWTELEKVVERWDRVRVNKDIYAMSSDTLVNDIGIPVLIGHENQFVNVTRNISTLRRIIAREGSNYLIETETIREEGAKGTNALGIYRDKHYIAVTQEGTTFKIKDYVCISRMMTKEPPLNVDSAITKRLVALNLAGEVGEGNKEILRGLMTDLYDASSARVLRGPYTDKDGASRNRGMYDCFNNDVSLLSSSKLEYLNSELRNVLIKYGTNTSASMKGVVTEWIGGADKQVEFTTEEVITYSGRAEGIYMQVYYLVSCMNDVWMIDERTILEQEDKSGDELRVIVERLG